MQITIDEIEIMTALHNYCNDIVKTPEGKKLTIDFKVGRGENSTRATLDFVDITDTPVAKTEPKKDTPKPEPTPEKEKVAEEPVKEVIEETVKPTKEDSPEPPTEKVDKVEETSPTDSLFNF